MKALEILLVAIVVLFIITFYLFFIQSIAPKWSKDVYENVSQNISYWKGGLG